MFLFHLKQTHNPPNRYTSLPASEGGRSLSGLPECQTIPHSPASVAHVSHLAVLEKEWESLTKDTCGRMRETSLASSDFQSCLASKLEARMKLNGSPENVQF